MLKTAAFVNSLMSMLVSMNSAMSVCNHNACFDSLPQLLKESNRKTFEPFNFHIDFLAMHPNATDTVAQWIYDKWHPYDLSLTKERMIRAYSASEQTDRLPLGFIVLRGDKPIGVVSLKSQTDAELKDLSCGTLWLGTPLFIIEESVENHYQALLAFAKNAAKQIGYDKLYVYTSSPENAKRYLDNGARLIEKRLFRGHQIDILVFENLEETYLNKN